MQTITCTKLQNIRISITSNLAKLLKFVPLVTQGVVTTVNRETVELPMGSRRGVELNNRIDRSS